MFLAPFLTNQPFLMMLHTNLHHDIISVTVVLLCWLSNSLEHSQIYVYPNNVYPMLWAPFHRDLKNFCQEVQHSLTFWHLLRSTIVVCRPWSTFTLHSTWSNLLLPTVLSSIFQRLMHIITLSLQCQSCLLIWLNFHIFVAQSQLYLCPLCLVPFLRG